MLEWLAMDGYGVFIWSAYAIAFCGLTGILASAWGAYRKAERQAAEFEKLKSLGN